MSWKRLDGLKPGMVIASDVLDSQGHRVLSEGQVLDATVITRLQSLALRGAVVRGTAAEEPWPERVPYQFAYSNMKDPYVLRLVRAVEQG